MSKNNYIENNLFTKKTEEKIENSNQIKSNMQMPKGGIYQLDKNIYEVSFGNFWSKSNLNFNDLVSKTFKKNIFNYASLEPYETIRRIRSSIKDNQTIQLIDNSDNQYSNNVLKYISSTMGFDLINKDKSKLTLKKRALLREEFGINTKYIIKEVENKKELEAYLHFLEKRYGNNQNYHKEIDGLFANHSDTFIVFEEDNKEILGAGRICNSIPETFLPMQLAVNKQTNKHYELKEQEKTCYGENLCLYNLEISKRESLFIIYPRILQAMTHSAKKHAENMPFQREFTTHREDDKTTGDLYKTNIGFSQVKDILGNDVILKYGTFGDVKKNTSKNNDWKLLDIPKNRVTHIANNPKLIIKRKSDKYWEYIDELVEETI